MRTARTARTAALAALVLSVTAGLPLAGTAQAADGILYVNNAATAHCSDSAADAGSQAVPFCTVSAAAKVVEPGQTVQIAAGTYREEVHLTRSGRPDAPITFSGPDQRPDYATNYASVNEFGPQPHGLSFEGVHDIAVRHLVARAPQEAVLVTDSSRITLDDVTVYSSGWGDNAQPAPRTTYPSLRITGQSTDVTVSHSQLTGSHGDGLTVDPGVTRTVVTTNDISGNQGAALSVTDATGTVVTGNSIGHGCGTSLTLAGNSSGATVENNILLADEGGNGAWGACPQARVAMSVTAASATGTRADYNVVSTGSHTPYVWGDRTYADVASFQQGTGQGAHDLSGSTQVLLQNREDSPAIDSADADAPGEQDTDLLGLPRADDPHVADTGAGKGHHDRGANELQDPMKLAVTATPQPGDGHPLDASLGGTLTSPWSAITQTSVDFGDGTTPVTPATLPLQHTFPAPGTYKITVTAANGLGNTGTRSRWVTIAAPGPLVPAVSAVRDAEVQGGEAPVLLRVTADPSGTVSPWPIASRSYDFGDGSTATANGVHTYAAPGTYTVALTVKDVKGRSATATRQVTVGNAFVPLKPTRVLDTRKGLGAPVGGVGPGGVLKLQVTGNGGVPASSKVTAVLLNLTATQPTAGSFVTAYPGPGGRPVASSLNFTAGQTTANAVVVPVGPDGTVSFYNNSGTVQLVADIQGYYADELTAPGSGNYLGAWSPTRVLDTRYGTGAPTGKVGPGGTLKVKVKGPGGVPDTARAVTLNLTVTDATQGGYVTAAPDGTPPSNSSLNFSAGQTVANQVTVPIDPDGTVTLYNRFGDVDLIADIQAFYAPPAAGTSPFLPVAPTRVLDTRSAGGGLGPAVSRRVKVTGTAGIPAGATAVLVNLTAVNPTSGGYLTAYAAGATRPNTSIVSFGPGTVVPNLAFVPVSQDGYIEVFNFSGTTDVLVDLQGFVA